MRYLPALMLCALVVSCTEAPSAPQPSTDQHSSQRPSSPASSDSAPPEVLPTIDVSVLPSPEGWSPRPQTGDEGPEIPWADQRDVNELTAILESYACLDADALPKPKTVFEGTYERQTGEPAVLEVMDFSSAADATTFAETYLQGSLTCGATSLGDAGLVRDIDGESWTEMVLVTDSKLILATVQGELTGSEAQRLLDELQD